MEKSMVTEYIIKYLTENHISAESVSADTEISVNKLKPGYTKPLLAEEFLDLCVYLKISPERISREICIARRKY